MIRLPVARLPRLLPPSARLARLLSTSPTLKDNISTYITTLPNGIRVASEDQPGHFLAAGVYIDAGSRYETNSTTGVSHILDRLSFRATDSTSTEGMRQRIETLGGNLSCSASRECIMYQASVFPRDIDPALALLADTTLAPALLPEDLADVKDTIPWEIQEVQANATAYYEELLHHTAFAGRLLGRPLMCPPDSLPHITTDTLRDYRQRWFRPERMVVAVAGAEHQRVVDLVSQHFGSYTVPSIPAPSTASLPTPPPSPHLSPQGKRASSSSSSWLSSLTRPSPPAANTLPDDGIDPATATSHYEGGVAHLSDPDQDFAHLYIGFRGLGVHDPDVYALATLQLLLGGGGSFSAGGPGKGMYSRLYTRVLSQHYWVEECHAFNQGYTDDGLFGIRAACPPEYAKHLPNVLAAELAALCIPGAVPEIEVTRAKNQLRSSLLMNLESRPIQLEDVGRQVQVLGKRIGAMEMCAHVDALTPAHLTAVARRILQSSPPSILLGGKGIGKFGDVLRITQAFGLGPQ